ncbi:MAG: thermonuclease family protein [Planctomycetota bacterium]|nr:MAG: thermonuclease family protein [Planctomycetota bacterium]
MAAKKKTTLAMSRRRRTTILVLCVGVAAFVVWLDRNHVRRSQRQPKSEHQVRAHDFEKYHERTFTVVNVVDGDTLDINIPDGKFNTTRVRLLGVDTPETKHPETGPMYFGQEAADFAAELALGKQITVYLEAARTRGYYGRLLAYVQLPDGSILNEVLLTEGLAYADLRFDHSFYHKYEQLQAAARSRKKGLWEQVTREQLPRWLQRENPRLLRSK